MLARTSSRLLGVIAALVLLVAGLPLPGQPARTVVESQPIVLHADEVATWSESGQRVVLLKGRVLAQQGLTLVRAQQAVVWVTEESKHRESRTSRAFLYAEGDVRIEKGSDSEAKPKLLLELATSGELELRSQKSKVVQTPQPNDPLLARAIAERLPRPLTIVTDPPAPEIRPVSHQVKQPQPPPSPYNAPPPQPTTPISVPGQPNVMPSITVPPAPGTPAPNLSPPAVSPGFAPGPMASPGPRPGGPAVPPARQGPPRVLSIAPRTGKAFETQSFALPNGEQAIVATGGIILIVRNMESLGLVDIEADQLVLWTKGGGTTNVLQDMQSSQGKVSRDLEFYLAGNVIIHQQNKDGSRKITCDEAYYDVNRNVAIAISADLEFTQPGIQDPVHVRADEVTQISPTLFQATRAEIFSSKLPSDPGLKVFVATSTIEQVTQQRRTIFGRTVIGRDTGQPIQEVEHIIRSRSVFLEVEDVPILYFPFAQGSAEHPLGPIRDFNFGVNDIFGVQVGVGLDVYDLFGWEPIDGTRWIMSLDYLSKRGPAGGSDFDYAGKDLFGIHSFYQGRARAFAIYDTGEDILGAFRNNEPHPDFRGRTRWLHRWWDMPYGFSFMSQVAYISDKNLVEQYYKQEWDTDIDQSTFAYLKQQNDNWAWTALVEPRIHRDWITQTEWLPRADGYLLGQSFFDLFTWNVHASAGYAQLRPTEVAPFAVEPTQVNIDTGRFDFWQELSLPLSVGPFRVVPYGILDLTAYTQDLSGDSRGRVLGGGGVRGSMPLTRLYPDICSDLWNLNGINHKIVFSSNFVSLASDTAFSTLPQLDELQDDATDQAMRDIFPVQPTINPAHGAFLTTSPFFDPQRYAIRRLLETHVDTMDSVEVLQLDIRQRWQTKRGYPGMQHITDWMILELSGSYFPREDRDNFGEPLAFLEYDWVWNIGDRTALVSTGWVDPIDEDAARVWTIGGYFNRPDRTSFFLGYRQIDPVDSRAVTGALTYILSPKYAVTGSTSYDFGTREALSNTLVLTRMGSDVQISFGVTYNAMQQNFGVQFYIVPNLMAKQDSFGKKGFGNNSPGGAGGGNFFQQ